MNGSSAPLALTAHLAWVSSISFGGFPTVLPDIRSFVVTTNGWMTDQEFANLFAMAQSIPGPNMILMMSLVGWKVLGVSRRCRERVCDLWAPLHDLLCLVSAMGQVPQRTMATDRPFRPGSGRYGACYRERHGDGSGGG